MIRELILVPRLFYCGILLLFGAVSVPFGAAAIAVSFLFLFIFSFVWQYFVLHPVLLTMNEEQRMIMIAGWMIVAFAAGICGLYVLADFDYLQDPSTRIADFSWRMTVYLVASGMFVGGVCARKAFERHGGL